jgi:dTDP-4-dehydrorhamnose 3,5-epimerase
VKVINTKLEGVKIIYPTIRYDYRGCFLETFNQNEFKERVGDYTFVQDNVSISHSEVLRGLHYQTGEHAQAKLVQVIRGAVLDVVVDIQPDSKTFGEHISIKLDADSRGRIIIPRGFAHGFYSLEPDTIFSYKCDNFYHSPSEKGIRFDDPDLGIDWGIRSDDDLIISDKDLKLPNFSSISF